MLALFFGAVKRKRKECAVSFSSDDWTKRRKKKLGCNQFLKQTLRGKKKKCQVCMHENIPIEISLWEWRCCFYCFVIFFSYSHLNFVLLIKVIFWILYISPKMQYIKWFLLRMLLLCEHHLQIFDFCGNVCEATKFKLCREERKKNPFSWYIMKKKQKPETSGTRIGTYFILLIVPYTANSMHQRLFNQSKW